MASWKKIIVSGSDAALNSLTVSTCVVGNVCGEASCATRVTVAACAVTDSEFSVVFADGSGNGKILSADASKLQYNPLRNALKIGNTGLEGTPGKLELVGIDSGTGEVSASLQFSPAGTAGAGVNPTICLPDTSGQLALTSGTINNANCLGGAPQACYVMMCGNQNVCGVKNFTSCVVASSGVAVTGTVCASSDICSGGIVRGANLCATASICGPMVCVSGTVTAGTLTSCGNVNIAGEIVAPLNSCLLVRVGSTVRACIDGNGICTPNTVRASDLCATNTICGPMVCVSGTVTGNTVCAASNICSGGTVRAAHICSVGSICGQTFNVSGNAIVGGNATISGDLTVNGTTTYLNTTNLAVEDKFILLNSGSNVAREGGLVIDEGSPSGSGHAFIYDADTSRWGFTASLAGTATSVIPDAFAAAVVTSDIVEYQKVGNIRISGEDIFIYS